MTKAGYNVFAPKNENFNQGSIYILRNPRGVGEGLSDIFKYYEGEEGQPNIT